MIFSYTGEEHEAMRRFDKGKPLIFIHIPKCAGTSINRVLKKWFGEHFFRHGFNKQSPWFRSCPYPLKPGICISGHFNRKKNTGVQDLYPEVTQFITFLRTPFETAVSQYFFWKKKRRQILLDEGVLKEGSENDFKNIADFFKKRNKSFILSFMPTEVTIHNYEEVLDQFIYIGIMEDLQTSINRLADRLGFPGEEVGYLNPSLRDETVPGKIKDEFIHNNRLEYTVYNDVLKKYKNE